LTYTCILKVHFCMTFVYFNIQCYIFHNDLYKDTEVAFAFLLNCHNEAGLLVFSHVKTVMYSAACLDFTTIHGCFRSYLHKIKKAPSPLCSCPEKAEQTARRLMIECSLFSKEQPAVLQNLPLPLIMQFHTNTVDVCRLLKNIYHMLQEQSRRDQIL
jgi:hypothetical protein